MSAASEDPLAADLVARALAEAPLFNGLDVQARMTIAAALRVERVAAGAVVSREGEESDRYYLVGGGEVEVVNARGRQLARLGPSEGFGEMGILRGRPRNATVRALTDAELLSLDRDTFLRTVEHQSSLLPVFEEEMALRSVATFLGESSPFRNLEPGALRWLALRMQRVNFPAEAEVVRRGEPGDACYLIMGGKAVVLATDRNGDERQIETLSVGEAFGEQALISGEPRSATVRALEPVQLLRLGRTDFEDVLARHRDRHSYFFQLALRRQRPRRASGSILERADPVDPYWVLKNPGNGRYLKLSERAAFLWNLMDGERTIRELTLTYFDRYGGMAIDVVLDLVVQLTAAGFLEIQNLQMPRTEPAEQSARSGRLGLSAWPSLATRYFSLPDVDRRVSALHDRVFWPLFERPVQLVLLLVMLAGTGSFIGLFLLGRLPSPPAGSGPILTIVGLLGLTIHISLHELGHAVTCKHFGREVHRAGVGWYFFLPVAFVDTTDAWMAPRRARMAVAFAGPYVNLVLSSLAALLIVVSNPLVSAGLATFALLGYLQTIVNMNPLIEFDGYYVLMDWLRIPNLRHRALAFIGRRIWQSRPPAPERRQRLILGGYGLLVLSYMLLVVLTVLTGYQHYFQGAVGQFLPPVPAGAIGWLVSGLMAWLVIRAGWSEVRRARGDEKPS